MTEALTDYANEKWAEYELNSESFEMVLAGVEFLLDSGPTKHYLQISRNVSPPGFGDYVNVWPSELRLFQRTAISRELFEEAQHGEFPVSHVDPQNSYVVETLDGEFRSIITHREAELQAWAREQLTSNEVAHYIGEGADISLEQLQEMDDGCIYTADVVLAHDATSRSASLEYVRVSAKLFTASDAISETFLLRFNPNRASSHRSAKNSLTQVIAKPVDSTTLEQLAETIQEMAKHEL